MLLIDSKEYLLFQGLILNTLYCLYVFICKPYKISFQNTEDAITSMLLGLLYFYLISIEYKDYFTFVD